MEIDLSYVWLGEYPSYKSNAVACYGVHKGWGYVWEGQYATSIQDVIGSYKQGKIYDYPYVTYPDVPVAWYENGFIWDSEYSHSEHLGLAHHDADTSLVWRGQYDTRLTHTPIANFDGEGDGALAALFLLGYLNNSETETADGETNESSGGSDSDGTPDSYSDDYSYSPSSVSSSSHDGGGAIWFVIILVVLYLLGTSFVKENNPAYEVVDNSSTPSGRVKSSSNIQSIPEYMYKSGDCCGERWIATRNVDVFAKPPKMPNGNPESLVKIGTIPEGAWVSTHELLIIAKRQAIPIPPQASYGIHATHRPPFGSGQTVYVYDYVGESCWNVWILGGNSILCGLHDVSQSEEVWYRISDPKGLSGWATKNHLTSQQGLNYEVELFLSSNPERSLEEKLAEVDRLIRLGADINAKPPVHAQGVSEYVVGSGDEELLRQLVLRGLRVPKKPPTVAPDPIIQPAPD